MSESELLQRYRAVRLPDVSDALDCLGFLDRYIMSPQMRPMWEGAKFVGIAHTVKLLPSARVLSAMPYEDYKQKGGELTDGCYGFVGNAKQDEAVVVDAEGISAGLFGSDVVMSLMQKGVVGMVIDGGCRDAREVRLERALVFEPGGLGLAHGLDPGQQAEVAPIDAAHSDHLLRPSCASDPSPLEPRPYLPAFPSGRLCRPKRENE